MRGLPWENDFKKSASSIPTSLQMPRMMRKMEHAGADPMASTTDTEFRTCEEFADIVSMWLMTHSIVCNEEGRPGSWSIPMDDVPGHIKVHIWDCPTFFRQSGGQPLRTAEKILATVAEIDRVWRSAHDAFPNMNLKIEECNESGGKMVFIYFPINAEAVNRYLEG